MSSKLTVQQFFARFPDEDACITHLMSVRFGLRHVCRVCGKESTFHKLSERRAFSCAHCGDHLYPCAGTVLEDSRTALQLWFYAIYLFVATRHGVSAKELERVLGVTYKCAHRMGHKIRDLMDSAQGIRVLQGHVEADEAYVGGYHPGRRGRSNMGGKTVVLGLKERGGKIAAEVIPNVKMPTLREAIMRRVAPGSIVSTDELLSYNLLEKEGYKHGSVKHRIKEWARFSGEHQVTHHVNSVESFWKVFKNSIRSTHIHVSQKYMNKYLAEFTFRANHRVLQNAMFDLLLAAL
jgi:transposase-like protein